MRNEIIPTLFALDKKEFNRKLESLKFSKKIHIDFMDGRFTEKKSVSLDDMGKILEYYDTKFSIHLMAYEPLKYLKKIKELGIEKVLIQAEVYGKDELFDVVEEFKENDLKVFVVLNPKTDIDEIYDLIGDIDGVMIMSVWPGKEGQEFIQSSLDKITELRDLHFDFNIQVDGGVNDTNAKEIVNAGANILSIGSYISGSENPEENYKKLTSLIKN